MDQPFNLQAFRICQDHHGEAGRQIRGLVRCHLNRGVHRNDIGMMSGDYDDMTYPLVNVYIANWKIIMLCSWVNQLLFQWPFSIAMLNNQMVLWPWPLAMSQNCYPWDLSHPTSWRGLCLGARALCEASDEDLQPTSPHCAGAAGVAWKGLELEPCPKQFPPGV